MRTSRLLCAGSIEVAGDIQCTVEDPEYPDTALFGDAVGDSVVAVQEDTDVPR
jgi:hypothetical protein